MPTRPRHSFNTSAGRIRLPVYTDTEKSVTRLVQQNLPANDIARELKLSRRTVFRAIKSARSKLDELHLLSRRVLAGASVSDINTELLGV